MQLTRLLRKSSFPAISCHKYRAEIYISDVKISIAFYLTSVRFRTIISDTDTKQLKQIYAYKTQIWLNIICENDSFNAASMFQSYKTLARK